MKTFEIIIDLDLEAVGKKGEITPPHIWKKWYTKDGKRCQQMMDLDKFIASVCEDVLPDVDPVMLSKSIAHHLRYW